MPDKFQRIMRSLKAVLNIGRGFDAEVQGYHCEYCPTHNFCVGGCLFEHIKKIVNAYETSTHERHRSMVNKREMDV